MADWLQTLRKAVITGSSASLASTAALALVARKEGKLAVQPMNATSHWLHGEGAGELKSADVAHTVVGYMTNHAACIFWSMFFEAWRARRAPASPGVMLREAVVMSAVAAIVDYGATPRRFTPGWELVLSKRGMAVAYGGLAAGLAAGALLTQSARASQRMRY